MKKIYLILTLALGLVATSCSDFLDRNPSTSLPENETTITTLIELQNAVNGIGYILTRTVRMTYGAEFGIYADLRGNDFAVIKSNGQSTPISTYQIIPTHALASIPYELFYSAIASVNRALESLDYVEYTEKEAPTFNNLVGQLLAWRGLLHFDLARYFCQIPKIAEDVNAPNTGLVLSTEVYTATHRGGRTTLKETY
ncbi:MAG: RagB/SusD family nutrient uptake outer membrane protein, partial [Bacteroidales bacterium]